MSTLPEPLDFNTFRFDPVRWTKQVYWLNWLALFLTLLITGLSTLVYIRLSEDGTWIGFAIIAFVVTYLYWLIVLPGGVRSKTENCFIEEITLDGSGPYHFFFQRLPGQTPPYQGIQISVHEANAARKHLHTRICQNVLHGVHVVETYLGCYGNARCLITYQIDTHLWLEKQHSELMDAVYHNQNISQEIGAEIDLAAGAESECWVTKNQIPSSSMFEICLRGRIKDSQVLARLHQGGVIVELLDFKIDDN